MLNRLTRLVASHPDKVAHYAVSNLLALVGMGVGLAFRSVPLALWLAAGLPLVVGIGKELWDRSHPPHRAELLDLICGVLGGLAVWLPLWLR